MQKQRRADGSIRLEGQRPSLVVAGFLILFAAIWNAVVWGLLVPEAIGAWKGGFGFWAIAITLFASVFCLVGVALIGLTLYVILSMFNPKVELTANTDEVRPGQELTLAWVLRGGRKMPEQLRIEFAGTERATYTRGTDTTTDSLDFLKSEIAATEDRHEIRSGSARYTIPEMLVPTLECPRNQIVYELRFTGRLPRWPDLREQFAIRVLPRTEMPAHTPKEEPAP